MATTTALMRDDATSRIRRRTPARRARGALALMALAAALAPVLLTVGALEAVVGQLEGAPARGLARASLALCQHPWAGASVSLASALGLTLLMRAQQTRDWVWLRRAARPVSRRVQRSPAGPPAGHPNQQEER